MSSLLPPGADFRRLWLATAISVFCTWAAAITLSVRMFRDTGSPEWVSALFVAEFAPAVVIGVLFAGRLDRLAEATGPLLTGGVPLEVMKPRWVRYDVPGAMDVG